MENSDIEDRDGPLKEIVDWAHILEKNHKKLDPMHSKDSLDGIGLSGFTIISKASFPGEDYDKAITVKDGDGNIYVHFYGTGDGNWGFNAAAYGGPPSPMQEWALSYFNETVEKYFDAQSTKELYVSGHSQGGNNAQFVTVRSEYWEYITGCASCNGPGFSHQFVSDSISLYREKYGDGFYERQKDKIWAYNGENDYVSCAGQEFIYQSAQSCYLKTVQRGL